MAISKKAYIAVGILIVAGAATAFAVPAFGSKTPKPQPVSAFGIKSTDSIYGYQRQPSWVEVASGYHSVSPPRPDPAFHDYLVQSDPATKRVCAVHAATRDAPALQRLQDELTKTYGPHTATPLGARRWSKGVDFVEIAEGDAGHQVIWDFTGSCYDANQRQTLAKGQPTALSVASLDHAG